MTTMIERPETVTEPRLETLESRNRGLRTTIAVLGIIVAAMGGWILFDYLGEADTAASADIAQLVDDYSTAWNAYDADAFLGLTTLGYRFESAGGMELNQADQAAQIESYLPRFSWSVEKLGEPIMTGSDPYYVSWPILVTNNIREFEGISVLTIVSEGDEFLVTRHKVIGDF